MTVLFRFKVFLSYILTNLHFSLICYKFVTHFVTNLRFVQVLLSPRIYRAHLDPEDKKHSYAIQEKGTFKTRSATIFSLPFYIMIT